MLIFSLASLTVGFLAGVTFSDRLVRPLSSTNITSSYSSIQILTNINKFWQILTNINKYHYIIFKYTLSKFVLPWFLDVTMFFSLVLTHHIYNPNLNGALFFFRYVPMKCIFLVKDLIISYCHICKCTKNVWTENWIENISCQGQEEMISIIPDICHFFYTGKIFGE